jgi:sugar phosphate permease
MAKDGSAAVESKTIAPQEAVKRLLYYRWVALVACFLGYMIAYAQRLSIGPLAPFMKAELGITKAQIGYYSSCAMAGLVIFVLPAGYLTDKIGVRWTLFIGQVVAGICLIFMLFAHSATMGMVVMFATGMGLGFIVPSTTKGVVEWFPLKERAMAMGIKQTSVNLGGLATAAILPTVAIAFGWRWGFAGLGVVAIISGIVCALIYRAPPKDMLAASASAQAAQTEISAPPVKKESWLTVFKSRDIYFLVGGGIALLICEMGLMTYFVLYLKTYLMIPVVAAGFLLGAIDIGGFFGKPIAGVMSDRVFGGRRKMPFIIMGTISTVFTVVFALLPVGTPVWLILVCSLIFGFAAVGWAGLYHTMIAECAGTDNAAKVISASYMLLMIGTLIGVPIFGHISDVTGSWTWSWIYLIILGIVGTLGLFFVREERRKLST